LFFCLLRVPLRSILVPYTTLFRSKGGVFSSWGQCRARIVHHTSGSVYIIGNGRRDICCLSFKARLVQSLFHPYLISVVQWVAILDRKSTRLNSSHVKISYAVFCMK